MIRARWALAAIPLLALAGCHDPLPGLPDRAPLAGVWVLTQVDTQTAAPFVTRMICPQPGLRLIDVIVADTMDFAPNHVARRHKITEHRVYADTGLAQPPFVADVVSRGVWGTAHRVVTRPPIQDAVYFSAAQDDSASYDPARSYVLYLQRIGDTLEGTSALFHACPEVSYFPGDQVSLYAKP